MEHSKETTIPLKSVYTPDDLKNFDYQEQLNDPGAFPYTRGRMSGAKGSWVQRGLSGEGERVDLEVVVTDAGLIPVPCILYVCERSRAAQSQH